MWKNSERGQILLIVVLTMIVALTVGLSIASRTVTELKLSKQNEESQRAFQAAEAGIEQALQSQADAVGQFANNAEYSTTVAIDNGSALLLNNGQDVDQISGTDVWLTTYPDFTYPSGSTFQGAVNVTLYFGTADQTTCASTGQQAVLPGIEVAWLEGSVATPTLKKAMIEPTICSRIGETAGSVINAAAQSNQVNGTQFNYAATISITDGLIMKIMPIFNSGKIGIRSSGPDFPSQGSVIESTGTSGDTVRKVVYYQSYPQLPIEVFPYSILSQ